MDIGYSEFSFGYAFTDNFIRDSWSRPTTAPTFPSLRDEGKWGYDIRIELAGRAVFFQYKRPELLTRNSAREIRDHALIHPLILLSNDTKDSLEYPLLHKHLQKPLHQWTDSLIRPVGNMVIQHQPLTKQRVRTIFHRVRL